MGLEVMESYDFEEIKSLSISGKTFPEIASELGENYQKLFRWVKEKHPVFHKAHINRKKISLNKGTIRTSLEMGKTVPDIGELLGITSAKLYKFIAKEMPDEHRKFITGRRRISRRSGPVKTIEAPLTFSKSVIDITTKQLDEAITRLSDTIKQNQNQLQLIKKMKGFVEGHNAG